MNLPPFHETGCRKPAFLAENGSCRSLTRVVRSRRPSLRTFVVVATCHAMPFDRSSVTTCILPARREEDVETEHWTRDDGRDDKQQYRTAKELRAAGFRFDRHEATRELVVVCPTCGNHQTTTANLRFDYSNEIQIVSCSWLRDEDERRLNEIAARLLERLLFRLTHPPGTPDPQRLAPIISSAVSDATKWLTQQPVSERIAS